MSYKRITYKDVAKRAGVSVATVSYVLNDGPRPVSSETRARVEEAIAELGYYPNEVARSLRLQHSSTIGLIIPNTANPVYAEIALELERVCTDAGFLVLLCNSGRQPDRERMFVQMLRAKGVDGVVVVPHYQPQHLIEPLIQARIPTVVLEHDLPGVSCVAVADLDGGRLATEHLINLGHQRIGLIRQHPTAALSNERLTGYRQALAAANLAFDPHLVIECAPRHAAAADAMQKLMALSNPPTAVFTHNDVMALGALHAIHRRKLRVPDDISVVGFDDIGSAQYYQPPLTTVRLPKTEMGMFAAQTLLKLVQGDAAIVPQTVILPVELVVRASTAAPRQLRQTAS
jgi:LacI family transcriptional regulator